MSRAILSLLLGGATGFLVIRRKVPEPASATCFSLVETAKANGLEPYDYLNRVLRDIASADTLEKLEALLPWHIDKTIK